MENLQNYLEEETEEERKIREETEVEIDVNTQAFVDDLVDKLMIIANKIAGHDLYPYQVPFARRFFESLIINDGATITALFSRQSGKTEAVGAVVSTAMIILPVLADIYPDLLDKYYGGVKVGAFAPVDEQADNLHGRIVSMLNSPGAKELMSEPEINDRVMGKGGFVYLKRSKSEVRKTTCHPRATIEGRTYHIILVDECQGANTYVIDKSVSPMGTATNATMVFTGTPARNKGVFWKTIQDNKREASARKGRTNHFEADYRIAGKYNPNYKKRAQKEALRLGYDSDEFKLSYRLMWLHEQGMFTTSEKFEFLGDKSMQIVHAHHKSPVVVGIDCGRKQDRTIVTVVWVNWSNPDPFGFYECRVLNWLDLESVDWEEQYFRIVEFLANYNVWKIGIDVGGLGDPVAQRLKIMVPHIEIVELGSSQQDQSKRWTHLMQLMEKGMLSWPAHAKTRQLRKFKRFKQEMEDLELKFKGPYVLAEAPNENNAHDDYPDSLAMACILTTDEFAGMGEIVEAEQYTNFFYNERSLAGAY